MPFGHSRDGKADRPISVYGVLTGADGLPVEVYEGNTGDQAAAPDRVEKLQM